MGCDIYRVGVDCRILFTDNNDDVACLCTFPCNDEIDGALDGERVRSLALLGAAVKMAHEGELGEDLNWLPECVPEWIRAEIKKHIIT